MAKPESRVKSTDSSMSKEYRTANIAKTTGTLFIKPPCTRCIIGEFVYVSPITVIYGCKRSWSVCAPPSLHLPFQPIQMPAKRRPVGAFVNHSLDKIEITGRYALVRRIKKSGEQSNDADTGNGPRPSLTAVCYANVGAPGYNR